MAGRRTVTPGSPADRSGGRHPGPSGPGTAAAARAIRARRAAGLGSLVGLAVAALWMWPLASRSGAVLFRDYVGLPSPALGAATWGLGEGPPRAVPLDAVVAIASMPGTGPLVLRLMVVAPLILAAAGAAVLLRRHGHTALLTGALVAVWNPYVVERLGIGQPPSLLGYAALPWVVLAVRASPPSVRPAWRVVVAAFPAALTPIGGLLAVAAAATTGALVRRSPRGAVAATGPALLCLPWVVAGLTGRSGTAEAAGAAAFAVRAEGAAGVVPSVLGLGGIWAGSAVPPSRTSGAAVLAALVLVVVAAAGVLAVRRRSPRSALWLAAAYVVPVAVVLAAGAATGLVAALQGVPGAALLRDTHRLLAPAAMAVALGCGLAVEALATALESRTARRSVAGARGAPVRRPAAALALALGVAGSAVLSVPDAPVWLSERYRPAALPAEVAEALTVVRDDGGDVLSMPWQPFRRTAWVGRHPYLDPLSRALPQRVLAAQDLQVAGPGGVAVVDRRDPPVAARWLTGDVRPADLRARGVRWVVEARGTPGAAVAPSPGLTVVLDGAAVRLWRVEPGPDRSGSAAPGPSQVRTGLLTAAWAGYAATLLGAAVAGARHARADRAARRRTHR